MKPWVEEKVIGFTIYSGCEPQEFSTYFPVIPQTRFEEVIFKALWIKQKGFNILPKEEAWVKDELWIVELSLLV